MQFRFESPVAYESIQENLEKILPKLISCDEATSSKAKEKSECEPALKHSRPSDCNDCKKNFFS